MYNDIIDASPYLTFCKHFERSFSFQTCKKRKNKQERSFGFGKISIKMPKFGVKRLKLSLKRLFGQYLAQGWEKLA